jgi:hypothetical protein
VFMEIDDKIGNHLKRVIGYLYEDERKDYDLDPSKNHIWLSLQALRLWLEENFEESEDLDCDIATTRKTQ